MCDYVLFENATGYALFEVIEAEDIGTNLEKVQDSILELSRFGKMVKLKAFVPFKSAEEALANINDISEGAFYTIRLFAVHRSPAARRLLAANCRLRVSTPCNRSAHGDAACPRCAPPGCLLSAHGADLRAGVFCCAQVL